MADRVSVIIPAFNAEHFIATAIQSVLKQNVDGLEVIVIDDGSTDATLQIAAGFGPPVRCVRQENGGPPSARNRGLSEAREEFIAFLDSDDVFEPGSLLLQLEMLKLNPDAEFVVGRFCSEELCTLPGEPMAFTPVPPSDQLTMSLGASLFRRTAFQKIGHFDEELRHCDDWDWFMRARELEVPMLIHQEVVLKTRLHMSNLTRNQDEGKRYMALMLKKSLTRRRKHSGNAQSLAKLSNSEISSSTLEKKD